MRATKCEKRRMARWASSAQWQKVRMGVVSALARGVTNGTFTHVTNSGHFIQREDPDLVVWAIRRVVDASALN